MHMTLASRCLLSDSLERGHSVVAESADTRQLHDHPGAEEHAG